MVLEDFVVKRIEVLDSNEHEGSTAALVEFYSQNNYNEFKREYKNNFEKENYFVMEELN